MTHAFVRFLGDESGATAIEYGLINVVILATLQTVGTRINTKFGTISNALN